MTYFPVLLIDGVGGCMSVWLPKPLDVVRWPIMAPVSSIPESDAALTQVRLSHAEFRLDYIRADGVRVYRWTRTSD